MKLLLKSSIAEFVTIYDKNNKEIEKDRCNEEIMTIEVPKKKELESLKKREVKLTKIFRNWFR